MNTRILGLACIVTVAVAVIAAWNVISPAPAHAGGVPGSGDADCSGVTDSEDALLVLQYDAGLLESGVLCPKAADTNANFLIGAGDAALILEFTAGLLMSLPPLPQPVIDLVLDAAADALAVPHQSLAVTAAEATMFSNSCLDLQEPGQGCLDSFYTGWVITVEGEGRGGVWHATAQSLSPYVRLAYLF